jgi:hypothetical protein
LLPLLARPLPFIVLPFPLAVGATADGIVLVGGAAAGLTTAEGGVEEGG